MLNFYCGLNYLYFVTEKRSGQLVGITDLVSPKKAKAHYALGAYPYFVEFYLAKQARGRRLMTRLFPKLINEWHLRQIEQLGVVVNRRNQAALKVIREVGFQYGSLFDYEQYLYLMSLRPSA